MTEPQPSKPKPDEKQNKRALGPFLLVATLLVMLLVINGTDSPARQISEDEFWYLLYTGQVEKLEIKSGTRLAGVDSGPKGERDFHVAVPDAAALHERVRNVHAKEVENPLDIDTFISRVESGDLVPVRGYPLRLRMLSDPDDADSPPRILQRFYVDYHDATGTHYTEVIGTDPNAVDLVRLTGLLRANGAAIEEGLSFDTVAGLRTKESNSFLLYFFSTFGPILLFGLLFWFLFMRQMRGQGQGLLSFGRSRAVMYNKENRPDVTFDNVAGIEEAKEEVTEIIEFLKSPEKFRKLGGRIPRGVLLVGPPGAGKTLLAKAIAGEAGVPFFSISGSDFVEMFVGVGASRVRDLFKQAKDSAPCIVFLDEIDAVGRKRGAGMGGGHDEREQTLNAILVEMDGFGTDEGVILLAATNRPDVLDPALLRPGRFDREIVIDLPDVEGREAILRVHTRKVKMSQNVDLASVARGTPGFSGAELAALVNEAAILAAMNGHESVQQADLEEARDKVRFGRQKKSRVMDLEDKRITAYHEAGHAVVNASMDHTEPVHKVTIIPRGMALGATMMLPEKDRLHLSYKKVLSELAVLYGGRVAEEMFCDDITSGASNDIQRATQLAKLMVTEWGMSERIGPVNLSERRGSEFLGTEFTVGKEHSEATVREIDEEVTRLLREARDRARAILSAKREAVERVAEALLQFETLHGDEVARLLEGTDPKDLRPDPPTPLAPEPAPAPSDAAALGRERARPVIRPGEEGLSPA